MDHLSSIDQIPRIIGIVVILLMASSLLATDAFLTLECGEKSIALSRDEFIGQQATQVETTREKKGMTIREEWTGVRIETLAGTVCSDKPWQSVVLRSEDNYQVRLSRQELTESGAIIAWLWDGKPLKKDGTRVIVPEMRQMFWIYDPVVMLVETHAATVEPTAIVNGDLVLGSLPIHQPLTPFEKDRGYHFAELAKRLFPDIRGTYLLIARDGVAHQLTFDPYLENAVIAVNADTLHLKSPDMPAGMWIKKLVYIQKDDLGVVFTPQLKDFTALAGLIDLDLSKVKLRGDDDNDAELNAGTPFSNPSWKACRKVLICR